MPVTFGFFNQKGGVGKTSMAINFAAWLVLNYPDKRVVLYDLDPQKNAQQWQSARNGDPEKGIEPVGPPLFSLVGKASETINREFALLSEPYDFVVLDGPANVSKINGAGIMCCDVVIFPTEPSAFDVWASAGIVAVAEGVQGNSGRKLAFLINKDDATNISADLSAALQAQPVPVLSNTIKRLVLWKEAGAYGKTIFEMDKRSDAVAQANAVFAELVEFAK